MKLRIAPIQQETPYSCTAAVLQMLSRFYLQFPMTHAQAVKLTKCEPDGAELEVIGKVLERPNRNLKRNQLRRAIRVGHPIITDDNTTYVDPHAILIHGMTRKGFWTIDPAKGKEVWRHEKWFANSTEFLLLN